MSNYIVKNPFSVELKECDNYNLVFDIPEEIDMSNRGAKAQVRKNHKSAPIVTKGTGGDGIAINGQKIILSLRPEDTKGMAGRWLIDLVVFVTQGVDDITVAEGVLVIKPRITKTL